jgi:glycosyltransferase involved in cell wall biosynthesis
MVVQKKVLILNFSNSSTDPRPRRSIDLFKDLNYHVTNVSYGNYFKNNSFYLLIPPKTNSFNRLIRIFLILMASILPSRNLRNVITDYTLNIHKLNNIMLNQNFDLIVVEDLYLLRIAFLVKKRGKVIFDAREYYPRQLDGDLWFDLVERRRRLKVCRDFLSRCDAILTVSKNILTEYQKDFNVDPILYRSTPNYVDIPLKATEPNRIKLVYHGYANRNRKIENYVELAQLLGRHFSIDLYLVGDQKYIQELKNLTSEIINVSVREPVKFENIIETLTQYDIGLAYYGPATLNLKYSLPNKFFEYLQARLMVVAGPSPDMGEIIKQYKCGIVTDSYSVNSLADKILSLTTTDIDNFKEGSQKAAIDLNFEKEKSVLIKVIESLANKII